jgi:hypothetical protein
VALADIAEMRVPVAASLFRLAGVFCDTDFVVRAQGPKHGIDGLSKSQLLEKVR